MPASDCGTTSARIEIYGPLVVETKKLSLMKYYEENNRIYIILGIIAIIGALAIFFCIIAYNIK